MLVGLEATLLLRKCGDNYVALRFLIYLLLRTALVGHSCHLKRRRPFKLVDTRHKSSSIGKSGEETSDSAS